MSRKGPRSLIDLLQSGDIGRLQNEAARRRNLTKSIRSALPKELAEHLVSASEDAEGRLVLAMDSAAWAAKLRYENQTLEGRQLRVRVVPGSRD